MDIIFELMLFIMFDLILNICNESYSVYENQLDVDFIFVSGCKTFVASIKTIYYYYY
jgi:hypothetical protein